MFVVSFVFLVWGFLFWRQELLLRERGVGVRGDAVDRVGVDAGDEGGDGRVLERLLKRRSSHEQRGSEVSKLLSAC